MAVSRARSSSHRALSEPGGRVRNLQGARYATTEGPSETGLYEEEESWSPRDVWGEHLHHHHDHKEHDHKDHDHEGDNDDDDDSKDDNNDDNDDDEDHSHSESSSQSGKNETESAAIQSSVVTNLDGINIGNTITIINIGTGSQGGGNSSSGSTDYVWNGEPPSHHDSLAVSDSARSGITSAAVRAFCESIGCSLSKSFKDTVTGGGSALMPAFSAGNREAGNEAQHENPVVTSSSSAVDASLARWLALIAILVQVG